MRDRIRDLIKPYSQKAYAAMQPDIARKRLISAFRYSWTFIAATVCYGLAVFSYRRAENLTTGAAWMYVFIVASILAFEVALMLTSVFIFRVFEKITHWSTLSNRTRLTGIALTSAILITASLTYPVAKHELHDAAISIRTASRPIPLMPMTKARAVEAFREGRRFDLKMSHTWAEIESNVPEFMFADDSKLLTVEELILAGPSDQHPFEATGSPDLAERFPLTNCDIEAPAFSYLAVPSDSPAKCSWLISAKRLGTQIIYYSARIDGHVVTGLGTTTVGTDILSADNITRIAGAIGILGTLLAMYLQFTGKASVITPSTHEENASKP